ncbi:hypothetical protein M405DRAFT_893983 [Rhizopogon salebrosus TDB-379]|nr:hypothetical protein M405DRAFT_893983 [Rhizopogon salebrosus TDB-379]
MSKFTWLNSPTRNNQNAQTLVDMIQIGQWYGTHKQTEKTRQKEPYRPTVKFRDIDRDLLDEVMLGEKPTTSQTAGAIEHTVHDLDNGDESDNEEEDNKSWDKPCNVADEDQVPEDDFLMADDDINLDSDFLRDMIATIPVFGVQKARMPQESVPVLNVSEPDWNF